MSKHGKRYSEATKEIDRDKSYEPKEAISLVKKCAKAKFDETVELHLRTGSDPKHADQLIRGAPRKSKMPCKTQSRLESRI